MNQAEFTDEITLPARAEKLGKVALLMGLVPSFIVRHLDDSWANPNRSHSVLA